MPDLSPEIWLLLAGAGFAAGSVNAIAGGGTFFSFAALLAAGLPPITANATSALSMMPGYAASSLAYRHEIRRQWRRLVLPGIASALGGLIGALILIRIGNDAFSVLVPWLLLIATVLFAAGPLMTRAMRSGSDGSPVTNRTWLGVAAIGQLVLSIYGGFFGAGMGIVLLAFLALTEGDSFHNANAAKNLYSILIQLTAVVLFISQGLISWPQALVVTGAGMVGGWFGVVLAKRVPEQRIRTGVLVLAIGMTVWFFWRQYR